MQAYGRSLAVLISGVRRRIRRRAIHTGPPTAREQQAWFERFEQDADWVGLVSSFFSRFLHDFPTTNKILT
jgi:hypothetical protein